MTDFKGLQVMSDRLTKEQRSWNMSRIKNKDTGIEVAVRKRLFSYGYRYRKNDTKLPGKPDIVLPKYKTVVFIHGCFWHLHSGCKNARLPKTNTEFWKTKLNHNVDNDNRIRQLLEEDGWKVITIWECEIENNLESVTQRIISELYHKPLNTAYKALTQEQ